MYLCSVIFMATLTHAAAAQEALSLRAEDGWTIAVDEYGSGDRGVVLVHGGRFTKGDWVKQARALVAAGFRVLAIDLRGFGRSKDGPPSLKREATYFDVLAAVRHLRSRGARTVSVIGASMGGDAAADALGAAAHGGEIDRVVLLAHGAYGPPEKLIGRKLFIVTREDANAAGLRLPRIQAQFDKAPEPKELIVLDGSAHAQFIFQTDQGERLMREILRFLSLP